MAHRNTLLATLGGLASLGLAYKLFQGGTAQELPLPPGPKSYPVIGQLLSMPTENQHLAFIDLGEELNSDIFSLSMFGTTIVVLNSLEDMVNLLEKRSGIYSDRMCPQMISDPSLMNWATLPSMLGYNDRWRKFRRFTHPWLHKGAVGAFHPAQQNQARLMLRNLLDASSNIESSLQLEPEFLRVTAATIMHSVYGRSLTSMGDPFISEIKEAFDNMCKAFLASNFMVNVFPSLKHIPEWFPGASWKTTARLWREQQEQAVNSPYEWAKSQIEQGVDDQSIVASMIAHGKRLGMGLEEIDDHVKQAAYNLVAGAMDTSANTLLVFILAMALFPEVQAKAQAEIDQVVGTNRLPTMGDSPNLPYTNRVIQELFRWCPILASGTPHACFKEDVYRGYRIPKGAIVLGNVWAVTRNSNVYKDPEVFNPDRFLDPNVPLSPTFGFGRRLCPGVHFAQDTLFITVVSILATFKITKFKDEHGNEITPVLEADNSATFHQKPFKLVMQPRSSTHESLIRASV